MGSTLAHMLFRADGRIRRRDYWMYSLLTFFVYWIVVFITSLVMVIFGFMHPGDKGSVWATVLLISPIYVWPRVCLTAKRWHDRNKSGYWASLCVVPVIGLVPFVGAIWTFIECGVLDGTQGPNRYGPSPKGIDHSEDSF